MFKFIPFAIILMIACQTVAPQEKEEQKAAVKESSVQTVSTKTRSVSKSRIPDQINATYPFDIELKDANLKTQSSKDLFENNGKPTVLLFWLTTCYPCGMEMKAINEKYEGWANETDFNFYAISTDWPKNEKQFVKRVKEKNWPWATYWDYNKEFRHIMPGKLNGLPQVFLLDKNGEIVFHKRKYSTGDEDKLYEKIKETASK